MATGSFIEMFMTVLGWHLYDIVWNAIVITGVVYIPLISILVDNITSPIDSQEQRSAASTSLRRMEVDIVRIIVVLIVCVQPSFTLNFGSVSHLRACENTRSTGGSTQTEMERILSPSELGGQVSKVPPWFYLLLSVTGGINDIIITQLPCDITDFRRLEHGISTAEIKDPVLKRNVQRFDTECYVEARADYFNNERSGASNEDLSWMGSKYFIDNYYQTHYAQNPVKGFAWDASRPSDAAHDPESGGYPSCSEWWTSLREKLIQDINPTVLFGWFRSQESKEQLKEAALKSALSKKGGGLNLDYNPGGDDRFGLSLSSIIDDPLSAIGDVLGGAGAAVGGALAEIIIQPTLFLVQKIAPYIQATILMSIYFLLPWVFVIGNYELSAIRTASITIFGIKFWTVLWAVVYLLDSKLLTLIYNAQASSLGGGGLAKGIAALTTDFGFPRLMVDILVLSLYLGLPYFFMQMLAWAGEKHAGVANDTAASTTRGAQQAGASSGELVKKGL